MTSAILTGFLLTKVTRRRDRFHDAGSPAASSTDEEARSCARLALEPQQRADCNENKLRLSGGTGEVTDVTDLILRLAGEAKR